MKRVCLMLLILFVLGACASQSAAPQQKEAEESMMDSSEAVVRSESDSVTENDLFDVDDADYLNAESISYTQSILDYFPFEADLVKTYESQDTTLVSFVQYMDENRIQFALRSNEGDNISVYERDENEIRIIYQKEDVHYRENYLDQVGFVAVYLRGPVEVGTSWVNLEGEEATITDVNVMINGIPSIEVMTASKISYYGLNVGLVKEINLSYREITESEVATIQHNQATDLTFDIYFKANNQWQKQAKKYSIRTNEDVKDYLLKDLINANVINEQTQILSLHKNDADQRVYLNVSQDIYTGLVNQKHEEDMLQSLVRSIGGMYDVDEIYIWVEGTAYQGPFVKMAKNDLLKIDN